MGRIYHINPTCPYCKEEHVCWNIRLTDDEQKRVDEHTKSHYAETSLYSLLSDPAIIVTRKLKCVCGKEFEAQFCIWKEDELNFHDPNWCA